MANKIKVCAMSDLHSHLPQNVEKSDLLILAGDICGHFYESYVGDSADCFGQSQWLRNEFQDWLDKIDAKEKILIFGNHDFVAERKPHLIPKFRSNVHVLFDECVEVLGLKVYGSAFSPFFYDWAFNAPEGREGELYLSNKWKQIPDDANILVVHGPPRGYGDTTIQGDVVGSPSLTNRIKEIKPILSVHGHIHFGTSTIKFDRGRNAPDGIIANVAVLDDNYKLVKPPTYFEIDLDEDSIEVLPPQTNS